MKKRMIIMLIALGILFGGIFLYKFITGLFFARYLASQSQVVTVSTMKVGYSDWQPKLKASGSLRAIRGVSVTTELAGLVTKIMFTPGATVKQGTLLVQLNADAEIGQLQSLQAQAALAQITYKRDQAQYKIHAVSKQTVDSDFENLQSLQGQVAQQAATVAKKTIRAPFTGRLGINNVNPGQYVNVGDKIVTLQTLDPIYADFYMPQQTLAEIKVGQNVALISDTFPKKTFTGKITTIEPTVDPSTRNVEVEATLPNPDYQLTPGMFATVEIITGEPKRFLTVPQSAISFNPYGDIVYVITQQGKDKDGKPMQIANQKFVITGQTRGDQITVLKGLKGGETIVTSGQLKLKNGSQIAVNNSVVPQNSPNPVAPDDH
jgi:membrane fusion protein (multidrug efflux system)